MPLSSYAEKQVLDWILGGASATQPSQRWIAWATGSPNDNGESNGSASRVTVTFAAANSPQGTVTNAAAFTGGIAGVAQTYQGWNLYDGSSGSRIAYGTFSANIGCKSGNQPGVAAGGLKITLS